MVDILTEALNGRSPSNINSSISSNRPSSDPPSRALPPPPSSSSTDPRRRPPLTNSDRLIERQQRRMAAARFDPHQARSELQNDARQLRQLLDESAAIIAQPLTVQEYAGEADINRAIKRRRIDSGQASSTFCPPYGRYGQVEPGKLNMEIHSCDGGIFNDERGAEFAAENVLKNDKSVYCTKGNRCNLVLQHQGGTPFTMTELVIKAPPRGYTAP